MPWDPTPAPAAPILSNPNRPQAPTNPSAAASVSSATGEVHVKRETAEHEVAFANTAALDRARQNLQDRFGSAASSQVSQLQARADMAAARRESVAAPPATGQMTDEQRRGYQARLEEQARLKQQSHMQNMQQHVNAQRRPAVANAQTDGAADWSEMVAARRDAHQSVALDADISIRQRVDQAALDMEAGGLMLPLSERPSPKQKSRGESTHPTVSRQVPQSDGPGDDTSVKREVDDEDAINSDLDDSDDDRGGESEDGDDPELMMCTYDKVQRVKNKWKCTLKDGVLVTGGKEYDLPLSVPFTN